MSFDDNDEYTPSRQDLQLQQDIPDDLDCDTENSLPVTCHTSAFRGKWRKAKSSNLRLTECPTPFSVQVGMNPSGSPMMMKVGCRDQSCPYCGPAGAWWTVCRVKEKLAEPDMQDRQNLFLTADIRDRFIEKYVPRGDRSLIQWRVEVFRVMTEALKCAIRDLTDGSKGNTRNGKIGIRHPAVDVLRVGAKHISEQGHLHIHAVLFVKQKYIPVRPENSLLPAHLWASFHYISWGSIDGFLHERYNAHLARILGVPGRYHYGVDQIGSIHLEPCADVEAVVCYVVMDGGVPWVGDWQFARGTRRVTKTPKLIPARRKAKTAVDESTK